MTITQIFNNNLDVIFFFYGLAYVTLGLIIFIQLRATGKSKFRIIDILWLLGFFGITHGANELLDMFIIIKGEDLFLQIIQPIFLYISYLSIFLFGYRLINLDKKRLGRWFLAFIAVLFLGLPLYLGTSNYIFWNVSSRYFLGFTGALLSAFGFILYYQSQRKILSLLNVEKYFTSISIFMAIYGLLGGLVVPKAGFFPASVINNASFISIVGIPVQFFRAICAVGIAWSVWKMVDIFNVEAVTDINRLNKELRKSRDELEERVEERTAELKESEEKYRSLVETTSDWIWETDENIVCTFASPQIEAILGYKPEEMIGKTPFDFMPESEAKRVYEIVQPIIVAKKSIKNFEYIVTHKDGHPVILETSSVPVFDIHGNFKGYRGIDRDITERRQAKELSDALNDINIVINSTLDFNTVMQRVVVEATKAMGCEAVTVLLAEDDGWKIKYTHGLPKEIIGITFSRKELKGGVSVAIETKKPLVSNDSYVDDRLNIEQIKRFQIRSLIIAPLITRTGILGGIYFSNHSMPLTFNKSQIDFAQKFAASVSLSIENARLYEAEHNIASTLQSSLLTVPEKIHGISFGHIYESSAETALVGGDFYDIFELENDRVGIIIGDIAGKGLGAAALTTAVKNAIKAHAYNDNDPATVVAKTNTLIKRTSSPEMFATVFFAVLDKTSGELFYCSAGHPPGMINRSSTIKLLNTNSPAVGVLDGAHFANGREILKKGDILVLYTDGVTEARHDNEFFGEQGLIEFLEGLKRLEAKEIPQKLYDEIAAFSRGKLVDDVAVLAVSLL